MGDDDDWGLSFEELDSLERNAAAEIASRKKCSSTVPTFVNLDSPKKISEDANAVPSVQGLGSPPKNSGVGCSGTPKKTGKGIRVKLFEDRPGRIAVESTYHADLVAALRTISGKRWDQPRKVWTYPEGELGEVVRTINSLSQLQVIIDVQPPLALGAAGCHEKPSAERNDCQEEVEIFSTPPQLPSFQGDSAKGVNFVESPKGLQRQSSEDGDWKCPQTAKAKLSQDSGSKQPPLKKKCIVHLSLHSSGKIAARFEYDSELVASIRKIPKSEWHAKERLWMFPFSSLSDSEKILSNISNRSVIVEPLVPLVKRALEATAALPDLQERYDSVPQVLKGTLMDFQVDGIRFALQHGGRALIADEMGLGKTLQALAVVSCLREEWPVLIVVPSSLRLNWATMVEKWLQIHPSEITIVMSQGSSRLGFNIVHTAGKHNACLEGLFNIVSYDLLTKLERAISMADFKIVVADESHYMKNPTAKRTNACVPVLQKAKYALLLTGTPALSRPIEMFKQLEALQPSVYRRIDEYGKRYCMGGYFGVWQGASNHDELHALVKSTVMIRRLKKDVMKQLPKKRREQVFIALDDKGVINLRELFDQLGKVKLEHRLVAGLKDTEESSRLTFLERQLLAQIYTESAEAKLAAVEDYLSTIIEAGCKFLVFCHHQSMMDGIQNLLQKKKVNFIRIDGKTPASSRQDLVRNFQEKSNVMVALLGIRAAGVGLTLTAASTVIFAEMSWIPGDLVQAEDRVHRIGQESAVNIYYLHAQGSIDDLIWDAVQHKLENLGQVLDGEEDNSLKIASICKEHEGTSRGQGTLDTYMRPCGNGLAVSGTISTSQGQDTVDGFLRPSNFGDPHQLPPEGGVSIYEASVRGAAHCNNLSSKRKQEFCDTEIRNPGGDEIVDLGSMTTFDDEISDEGQLNSELFPCSVSDATSDRYPQNKKSRQLT